MIVAIATASDRSKLIYVFYGVTDYALFVVAILVVNNNIFHFYLIAFELLFVLGRYLPVSLLLIPVRVAIAMALTQHRQLQTAN